MIFAAVESLPWYVIAPIALLWIVVVCLGGSTLDDFIYVRRRKDADESKK